MTHLLVSFSLVEINNPDLKISIFQEGLLSKEPALGVWNYTMTNVDSVYDHGVLFVTKNENTYDIAVKFSNGILNGQDVVVKNNKVNFNINIAGLERVSFVLMIEGDKIMGESYSEKGSSAILGERQHPER
ncbi:hypothetical protein [Maribacter hydrothermalis]|uniref:hypothetical protein n=1 Tax=Maribacter hydrothermalis TaxID=1836467 RepID=UPI0012F7CD29|nr:hypothetical protein [Maribacter hydrothermalis]